MAAEGSYFVNIISLQPNKYNSFFKYLIFDLFHALFKFQRIAGFDRTPCILTCNIPCILNDYNVLKTDSIEQVIFY